LNKVIRILIINILPRWLPLWKEVQHAPVFDVPTSQNKQPKTHCLEMAPAMMTQIDDH
jgi:hypothetical protein